MEIKKEEVLFEINYDGDFSKITMSDLKSDHIKEGGEFETKQYRINVVYKGDDGIAISFTPIPGAGAEQSRHLRVYQFSS